VQEDKKNRRCTELDGGLFKVLPGGSVFRVFQVFLWLGLSIFSASPMLYPIIAKATPAVFFVGRSLLFFVKKVGKVFHVNLIKFSSFGKKTA
jgi:hypothetical protein